MCASGHPSAWPAARKAYGFSKVFEEICKELQQMKNKKIKF